MSCERVNHDVVRRMYVCRATVSRSVYVFHMSSPFSHEAPCARSQCVLYVTSCLKKKKWIVGDPRFRTLTLLFIFPISPFVKKFHATEILASTMKNLFQSKFPNMKSKVKVLASKKKCRDTDSETQICYGTLSFIIITIRDPDVIGKK